jgi:hypothetical protein
MNNNFSEIKEYFVILEVTDEVHSFITVTGQRTDRLYLAESFSTPKEAKRAIRAYSKFGHEKYAVARIIESHSYKVNLI